MSNTTTLKSLHDQIEADLKTALKAYFGLDDVPVHRYWGETGESLQTPCAFVEMSAMQPDDEPDSGGALSVQFQFRATIALDPLVTYGANNNNAEFTAREACIKAWQALHQRKRYAGTDLIEFLDSGDAQSDGAARLRGYVFFEFGFMFTAKLAQGPEFTDSANLLLSTFPQQPPNSRETPL